MKICKVCKKELPEDSFYLNRGKYRLHTCKYCLSKRATAYTIRKRKIRFSRAWYRRRFERFKRRAKDRGIKFELTFEEFCHLRAYKDEKCFYCGITNGPFSVDRLDNTKGYSVSNCVVACFRCNKIKSSEFVAEEMKILGRALRKIDEMRNI